MADVKKLGLLGLIFAVCWSFVGFGYLFFVLSAVTYALISIFLFKTPPEKRGRSMSFMSDFLAKGFPKNIGVPDFPVISLIYYEQVPDAEKVKSEVVPGLLEFLRMRCIPGIENGESVWVDFPDFDISNHVIEHTVESEEDISALVNKHICPILSRDKPLWEIHLMRNTGPGLSAAFIKISHCIGDGISLLQVFLRFMQDKNGMPLAIPDYIRNSSQKKAKSGLFDQLLAQGKIIVRTAIKCVALPVSGSDTFTAIRTKDPPPGSPWDCTRRVCVYSEPISMDIIKNIKNAFGCTVNDVVASVLAGALRRYLAYREDEALKKPIRMRALVPFAFPRTVGDELTALRNLWCFLSLSLPINEASPVERLKAAKASCDELKNSPEALFTLGLQVAGSKILPFSAQAQTAFDIMKSHSLVFTNVPGPAEMVHFASTAAMKMYILVGNIIPQVSVISYNGKFTITFVVDDQVVTEPHKLISFFEEELLQSQKEICKS